MIKSTRRRRPHKFFYFFKRVRRFKFNFISLREMIRWLVNAWTCHFFVQLLISRRLKPADDLHAARCFLFGSENVVDGALNEPALLLPILIRRKFWIAPIWRDPLLRILWVFFSEEL